MAALGLTRGQIGLGATIYSGLMSPGFLDRPRNMLIHQVSRSLLHPYVDLGPAPLSLSGQLRVDSTALVAALVAFADGTSKKLSFLLGDALEVYYMVESGSVTVAQIYPSAAVYTYWLNFTCQTGDTRLYKASDSSILVGA
jgi:hypothetical protein